MWPRPDIQAVITRGSVSLWEYSYGRILLASSSISLHPTALANREVPGYHDFPASSDPKMNTDGLPCLPCRNTHLSWFADKVGHSPRLTPPLIIPLLPAQRCACPTHQHAPVLRCMIQIPAKTMPTRDRDCIPTVPNTVLRRTRAASPVHVFSSVSRRDLRLLGRRQGFQRCHVDSLPC